MEDFSDDQLVFRARTGDTDAFTTLALRHREKISHTIYWMTKNAQDADDLCQEAFLHAYKHLAKFRGNSSIYTWIYRIAVNLTLNFLKKKMREKHRSRIPVEDCSSAENGAGLQPTPEEKILGNELRAKLRQAIRALPDPYQMSFILVVIQGMSHSQASEVLGCSEKTVSWRMFKARKLLQRKLIPYLGESL
jgi:RNA polymerase sigma-70 factor (ECF subfamily)